MVLDREMDVYHRELAGLLAEEGKFVLIHGDEVHDVYTAYEDALRAGYQTYGTSPFLVKKIEAVESVYFFIRPAAPCPS